MSEPNEHAMQEEGVPEQEKLLIKHAVGGRTFLDSSQTPVYYEVVPEGDGWLFVIRKPPAEALENILRWKDELNVFRFYEYRDQPTEKHWFYIRENAVRYNAETEELTIYARSNIEYVPDEF
ncbi:hypothetical protein [Gorillibacterium sp. sgz500922]|uniref:hypothetical protein n=1 Tax=Gorillibacterium sp. sgz500922 TaxID=3446694 RepID=UPI003F680F81